jgi:hypothetical protein
MELDMAANAEQLVDDRAIARLLTLSPGWVRKQRFLRRHRLDHIFTVDPVMIGSVPRYKLADVLAWIEARASRKA